MKRSLVKLALAAATASLLAVGGTASAGYYQRYDTFVFRGSGGSVSAMGSVSGARTSSDTTQFIGCGNESNVVSGAAGISSCSARDSNGTFAYCRIDSRTSGYSYVRDAISMVGANSYITFDSDKNGRCTKVRIDNESRDIP